MDDALTALYNVIESRAILKSATITAYPDTVLMITWTERSFMDMPDTERPEYADLILVVIESMRNLGLLSLPTNE